MRSLPSNLVLLAVLAAAPAARGDFNIGPTDGSPRRSEAASATFGAASGHRAEPFRATTLPSFALVAEDPWSGVPAAPMTPGFETEVRELPGLPGSRSLFLSAMLTVGAWHLVRRAGHLHLLDLPAWYHPDAPPQIGHSVAFDLQYAPIVACSFDEPARQRISYRRARDECVQPRDDGRVSFLLAPRAPPVP